MPFSIAPAVKAASTASVRSESVRSEPLDVRAVSSGEFRADPRSNRRQANRRQANRRQANPTNPGSSPLPRDSPASGSGAPNGVRTPPPTIVRYPTEVRPLPGSLDGIPVFNSNSPELVLNEGILLSTFPEAGRRDLNAHLDYAFEGRFDIFSHHISRARTEEETRSLFQGILVENPTSQPVRLEVFQGASYLTRPDALFLNIQDYVDNPLGTVFSGPGSRAVDLVLRGRRQSNWPPLTVLQPYESRMLMNLPIPAGTVVPTSNGRSTLLRLFSDGPVYVASLAMFAPKNADGNERIPTLEEWQGLLDRGSLVEPRDLPPTPLADLDRVERAIYSRVAGVSIGSRWDALLTDSPETDSLTIPAPGEAISYGISTLHRGRLGSGQVQTAPMVRRYNDTAVAAHGNYGVEYALNMPLFNSSDRWREVTIAVQTPVKADTTDGALSFFDPPEDRIFFRGTVRLRYNNDRGRLVTRYIHLVQRRGQLGEPLVILRMPPGDRRLVELDLIYPPDATPPQVVSIRTED